MNFIYFALTLGIIIFIHELGHFIFAKRAGVYVYEFSLGMGPKLFSFERKNDETIYSIRLFPIGGYVQMAGETIEDDNTLPPEKHLVNKTWSQKFMTLFAGVLFNFILAIIIFFIVGLLTGVPISKSYIEEITPNSPASNSEIAIGDEVIAINKVKTHTKDLLFLELATIKGEYDTIITVKRNNEVKDIIVKPVKHIDKDNNTSYVFGFKLENKKEEGLTAAFAFAFTKTISIIEQMGITVWYLITGKIDISGLAGPVGIFNIVKETAKNGFINSLYLTGFLSVNVGFINLLPIPAFDGGRIVFLMIEKIFKRKVDVRIENLIHNAGMMILLILMLTVTINDIIRMFRR